MELEGGSTKENGESIHSQQNIANTQPVSALDTNSSNLPHASDTGNANQIVLTAATTEQLALISQQIHSEQEVHNALELFRTTLDYALDLHKHTNTFCQTSTLTVAHLDHLTSLQSIQEELNNLPPRLEKEDKTKLVKTRINIRNSITTMRTTIINIQYASSRTTNTQHATNTEVSLEDSILAITEAMKTLHTRLVKNRQLVRQAEAD